MVAVVVFGLDMLGIGGIARQGVEVDHAVELPALADPVVDRLPLGLFRLVIVAVQGRAVERILERRQGRAQDSHVATSPVLPRDLLPLQRRQTEELSLLIGRDFREWKTLYS